MNDGVIRYKKTKKQILLWWQDLKGNTQGQLFYPRTALGLNRAQRRIQIMIDKGYTLADEALTTV